jgi:uncharacterized protein YbbK (DUF523 family)
MGNPLHRRGGRPRVGVSACLLGQPTRYDGGHRLDRFIAEELGGRLEWVPLCPEVELGLGVPRETMRLEGDPQAPRLVTTASRRDLTAEMEAWCARRVEELAGLGVCGFILKKGSPSCGVVGVPVAPPRGPAEVSPGTTAAGAVLPAGVGLFARAAARRFPALPCCDEEMLADPEQARLFLQMVERYGEARESAQAGPEDRRPA